MHWLFRWGVVVVVRLCEFDTVQMDEKSVRSLNGTRVTDSMLSLVPNRDTFRTTLRKAVVVCVARVYNFVCLCVVL